MTYRASTANHALHPWTDGLPSNIGNRLRSAGTHNDTAIDQLTRLAEDLEQLLEHHQPSSAVDRFLAGGEQWVDHCNRYATLRTLELLSQLPGRGATWPGWKPEDPNARRRVLAELEISLVRFCSLRNVTHAAAVGALDGGVVSGELHRIYRDSVDDVTAPSTIDAPGTTRDVKSGYPEAAPRTVPLPPWSRPAWTRLVGKNTGSLPVLYLGASREPSKIQSSVLMAVGAVLKRTGLAGDPTVKPLSIRNTFGRRIRDELGLEAAAEKLGHRDFTSVARELGLSPHLPVRQRR